MNKKITFNINSIIIITLIIFLTLSNTTSAREKQTITIEEIKKSARFFIRNSSMGKRTVRN